MLEKRLLVDNHIVEWGYDSLGRDKKFHGAYYVLSKVSAGIFTAFMTLTDHSLFSQLRRNKVSENALIVTDVTGSMYPYYSQLLVWHALKLSQGKKYNYAFFNDGDQKTQSQKVIGETGGIYLTKSAHLNKVYEKMYECMKGGFGGDTPENNFEATLAGLSKFKNTNQIILICDNNAVPRDCNLLRKINQPIDFIMCGAYFGVDSRYIELARQNNGRLITVENSLENLNQLEENEIVRLGNKKYRFRQGSIRPLNSNGQKYFIH